MELPLFPLQSVLFPDAPVALHVFEDRYRQMFARVLDGDRRFGVVAIVEGREVGGPAAYEPVGCVAEVAEMRPYPDGRLDVAAVGRERFRIDRVTQATPFVVAEISTLPEIAGDASQRRALLARGLYARYLRSLLALADAEPPGTDVPADPVAASYAIAAGLQIDLGDKQRLLAAGTAEERLLAAIRLLRRETALLEHLRDHGPAPMAGPFSLN